MRIKKIHFVNEKDVDVFLRDAYGKEHIVFPREKKDIVIIEKSKGDRKK